MKRSASEIIRNLETRIARLESRSAMYHPDDPRSQEMGGYREPIGGDWEEPERPEETVQRLARKTVKMLKRDMDIDAEIEDNTLIIKGVVAKKDFFKPWQLLEEEGIRGVGGNQIEMIYDLPLNLSVRGRKIKAYFTDHRLGDFNLSPQNKVMFKGRGRNLSLHIPLWVY